MTRSKSQGLIVVHKYVSYPSAATPKPSISEWAVRAEDVKQVRPIKSATEPEAHASITVGDETFWVTETLAEITALCNARLDRRDDQLERIATALESWRDTNFGRGI